MQKTSRLSRTLLPIALAAASACAPSSFAAQAEDNLASQTVASNTQRLIIKYKDSALAAKQATPQAMALAHEAVQRQGVQMKWLRTNALGAHVLKLDRSVDVSTAQQLADSIKAIDPAVEYAEPDRLMQPLLTPNDPSYNSQWHYFEAAGGLNLPLAWDKSTGTGVVVSVIDTGIRAHADLAANLRPGHDFISDLAVANDGNGRDTDPSDPGDWVSAGECGVGQPASNSSWHGTHVAGTIAAVTNNGSGVAGVAFGAKVSSARVLGKCGGYTSDIADAIIWASGGTVSGVPANANPARVINMSLGGGGACDTTTQSAINSARSRNTVIVVAAGNSNANVSGFSPASCSGVITVAAVGRNGGKASYSNYGAMVDVAAPGGNMSSGTTNGVLSTLNSGSSTPGADSTAYYQGTSMAAPHVAGVAALMLSVKPTLTPDQVESLLKSSARAFPATCTQCGTGIVDALAAVNAALGITPPPANTINEVESNNTLATAQLISTTPVTVNGTVATSTDTDYFKLTVGAGKTLTAKLTPNASSDYDLYLYNTSGTQLASATAGTGAVDTITRTNTGSTAVTWTVRVRYYSGGVGSTSGKYTLNLTQ